MDSASAKGPAMAAILTLSGPSPHIYIQHNYDSESLGQALLCSLLQLPMLQEQGEMVGKVVGI